MYGACARCNDQRATRVLVQQSRRGAAVEIADRIDSKPCYSRELGCAWQYLQQQRIAWITAAHTRDITARHAQREFTSGSERRCDQLRVEAQGGAQLSGIGDCIRQRLLP